MTTAEKLAMLKSLLKITGSESDADLTVYLDFSKRELIAWRYGYCSNPPIARAVDSADNTVSVTAGIFIAVLAPTNGTSYVFTYSETAESWQHEIESVDTDVVLADYGLSVTGTPVDGETITVKYTEAPIAEYDTTQVMACVVGFGLSGAEGQISHNENGIQRSFKYADMVMYLRQNVPAYIGVL
jgi:hypothetical protein